MTEFIRQNEPPPKFSVIVPTFNRVSLLPRAVNSVLSQEFSDFEIIIVDDASTDETAEYAKSLNDTRVVYVRRHTNGGQAATFNTGIQAARGKLVTFLDDDDEFLPKFLGKMVEAFANATEEVGFGWCGVRMVQDTPAGERLIREKRWDPNLRDPSVAITIGSGYGLTLCRSVLEKIGMFDENLRAMADAEFLFRLVQEFSFLIVPEVLVTTHEHRVQRLTGVRIERAIAIEAIISRNADFLAAHPKLAKHFSRKAAVIHYRLGNRARARHHMRDALESDKLNLGTWKTLAKFEVLRRK